MLVEKITTDPAEAPHVMRGAIVRMRRARWRVVDIRPFDGCAIVTLARPAPPHAGLLASELRARGAIDRLLVLAPAGLREQWVAELHGRFAIEATLVDAHSLRRIASTLPIDLNPWTTLSAAVASIDYVKRPEVLPLAARCLWDLIVVDEAHASAAGSDRRAAVHALCARASYVLLLTATPHNGD